jgi:hypothetical protein
VAGEKSPCKIITLLRQYPEQREAEDIQIDFSIRTIFPRHTSNNLLTTVKRFQEDKKNQQV